jgi:fibronectin-binding autotransporter adhesin
MVIPKFLAKVVPPFLFRLPQLPFPSTRTIRTRVAYWAAIAACSSLSHGATWVWNAPSGLWSDPLNWLPVGVPESVATTEIVFGGIGAVSTNDLPNSFTLNRLSLNLDGVASPVIGGGVLNFAKSGELNPAILQGGGANVVLQTGITGADPLRLAGGGTGVVELAGKVSVQAGLTVESGYWRFRNVANDFSGGLTINTGATLEAVATSGPSVATRTTSSLLGAGTGNPIDINGGTLKFGSTGAINSNGTGGHIMLGGGTFGAPQPLPIRFGPNGGVVDLVNTNPQSPGVHAGTIGFSNPGYGGDLGLTLNNTAPAVVRFNGGELGLSSFSDPGGGDWLIRENALRFTPMSGNGPIRVELSNGALARAGSNIQVAVYQGPFTYRGSAGGDPTSGALGVVNSGISRGIGRVAFNRSTVHYNGGLFLEGSLQFAAVLGASAINGHVTLQGVETGFPAYVSFSGRATNNRLGPDAAARETGTDGAQNFLYLGVNKDDLFSIGNGAVAAFDARVRMDQAAHHGVKLDARAVLQAGATLRVLQSLSNFSPVVIAERGANVGDIVFDSPIEAKGSSVSEAVLDLRLPTPSAAGTIANGIPTPITEVISTAGVRPFGGLVATSGHTLIINGTGFGGLRVEANARPDALFSSTGLPGGGSIADPTSSLAKINGYLTADRLAGITGIGGYLTVAPIGQTWNFPSGGEWAATSPVGLKVSNHHAQGVDVSLAGITAFQHSVAVDGGAVLDLGSGSFNFGPSTITLGLGRLEGEGKVSSTGTISVSIGGTVAPGMAAIGRITLPPTSLAGTLEIETSETSADRLEVLGELILGASSRFVVLPTSVLGARNYKFATAQSVQGEFGEAQVGGSHALDYSRPGELWLRYTAARKLTWTGAQSGGWDKETANWSGGQLFTDTDDVRFDDTAPANRRTINIPSGIMAPHEIVVDTASSYSLISSLSGAIGGYTEIIKSGTGTLTLSGPALFEGGILVNAGGLTTVTADSIPDVGRVTIGSGAALQLGGAETIEELFVRGSVQGNAPLRASRVILQNASAVQVPLGITESLTKSGAAFTLAGPLDLQGGERTISVLDTDPNATLTLGGIVSNGGLLKVGPGVLVLGSQNTFGGGLNIQRGAVSAQVAGALPAFGAVTVGGMGTLDLAGTEQNIGNFQVDGTAQLNGATLLASKLSGAGSIQLGDGLLTLQQSEQSTFTGAIDGTGSLSKSGFGSLGLSGVNGFTGGIVILEGSLRLLSPNASGTGRIVVEPNGTLVIGATTSAPITLAGGILAARVQDQDSPIAGEMLVSTNSTVQVADRDAQGVSSEVVLTGVLRGSGNLQIIPPLGQESADRGPGFRLRGTQVSDYSGTITVRQRVKLELESSVSTPFSPAGAGKIVMTAGTHTDDRGGTYSQLNLRNDSQGDVFFGNNVEITGVGLANFAPVGDVAVPPDGLANTRVHLGNLRVGAGQIAAVNKNGEKSQVVQFSSVTLTGGTATFSPKTPGFKFVAGSDMVLGPISEEVPGSGIIMDGEANLVLLGGNTYTGATTIQRGATWLGAANALPSGTKLRVIGGKLDFQNTAGVSFSQTVAELSGSGGTITNTATDGVRDFIVDQTTESEYLGQLEGGLNLVKRGSGLLRFTGIAALDGQVYVEAGTLSLSDAFFRGTIAAPVNVAANALFEGYGTVEELNVASGGAVRRGAGYGALTLGDLSFGDGAEVQFALGGSQAGVNHSQIQVNGTLTMEGDVVLKLDLDFQPVQHTDAFTILLNDGVEPSVGGGRFIYGGTRLENGARFLVEDGAFSQQFELRYDGNDGNDVLLFVVPEPGTSLLLLGGMFLLARRRRR